MTLSRPDRIRWPNWPDISERTRINPDLHISINNLYVFVKLYIFIFFCREAGGVMRLQHLVIHSDRTVKLAALQALANMALNTTNQKEMEVSWWKGNFENLVKSMSGHWSCWKPLSKPKWDLLLTTMWFWIEISFLKFITLTRSYFIMILLFENDSIQFASFMYQLWDNQVEMN